VFIFEGGHHDDSSYWVWSVLDITPPTTILSTDLEGYASPLPSTLPARWERLRTSDIAFAARLLLHIMY